MRKFRFPSTHTFSIVGLALFSIAFCAVFWARAVVDLRTGLGLVLALWFAATALCFAVLWAIWIIYSLASRQWRFAATIIAVPIASAIAFDAVDRLGLTAEYADFLAHRYPYAVQVAEALREGRQPLLLAWYWGDTGGPGAGTVVYTLVYDESDEIARPRAQRSAAWLSRADKAATGNSLYSVVHPEAFSNDPDRWLDEDTQSFGHHFYLVQGAW